MSYQFAIRFDHIHVKEEYTPQQAIDAITEKHDTFYIWCNEKMNSDNAHTHIYMDCDLTETTLRNRIRKYITSGNKAYSLVPAKYKDDQDPTYGTGYIGRSIAYCMKGDEFDQAGIPDDIIDKCREYDEDVKMDLKTKKSKNTQSAKYRELCELIEAHCESQRNTFSKQNIPYPCISQNDIIDIVIKYYKDQDLSFSVSGLTIMVNRLSLKYIPGYESHLAALISKSLKI